MRARLDPKPNTFEVSENAQSLQNRQENLRQAIARREALLAHIAKVTAEGSAEPQAPPAAQAGTRDPSVCYAGDRCRILEKTIFCDTLGLMQAVLAKPAGPQRRKLLHELMAQRACLVLEPGTLLYPHGDVLTVRPIGEAPTNAAAARLEGGREGFVLASAVGSDQTASR